MVFAGCCPGNFFSTARSPESSGSLVDNSNLIGKVYFPRLIIPMASVFVALVDFLVTLSLLAATMAWYRFPPSWQLLAFHCSSSSRSLRAWVRAYGLRR
jgi:lipopolysaccharide transport system permease protein